MFCGFLATSPTRNERAAIVDRTRASENRVTSDDLDIYFQLGGLWCLIGSDRVFFRDSKGGAGAFNVRRACSRPRRPSSARGSRPFHGGCAPPSGWPPPC